jgi:arginine decarboxylase-like protein
MPKQFTDNPITADPEAGWSSEKSAELYGINAWGAGYFNLSAQGEAQVNVDFGDHQVVVSIMDIVLGMRARGLHMPAVLRMRRPSNRVATRTITAVSSRSKSTSSAT